MFTLRTGPFHPDLEASLADTVRQFKAIDVQAPLTVVVPSDLIRRRVQWVLCVEHRLSLFNVSCLTFHQLGVRLQAERFLLLDDSSSGERPIEMVSDRWYEWLVSGLQSQLVSDGGRDGLTASRGMRQAMWRTIRDLQEAQVDPQVALCAVKEGVFDEGRREHLERLFSLQAAVRQWSRHLHVGLPDDVARSVLSWVSRSPFLSSQTHVLYYGFYDLTQVQLSLLEEVARTKPLTVFFPLEDGAKYQFARRFFEQQLLKGGVDHQPCGTEEERPACGGQEAPSKAIRQVAHAVGPQGELLFACKTILELVGTGGYAFHEIGIVARDLEVYRPYLTAMLYEHRIPFLTTVTRPFLEESWAKIWWKMVGLRMDDFPVESVMDIVLSPYFRGTDQPFPVFSEHAHWWRRLVREARIVRGRSDWGRFASLSTDAGYLQEQIHAGLLPSSFRPADIQHFVRAVCDLIEQADSCPLEGTVGELTACFERLFAAFVLPPDYHIRQKNNSIPENCGQELLTCQERVLATLRQWDRLGDQVTAECWVSRVRELLEDERLPLPGQSQAGVAIMDAMAARGYAFRAMFLLGMNDQVFPRVVREDAFLRDRERRILAESLGYKIDEKLKGYEEESLLWGLLQRAARERQYVLYQRADAEGRPLIPSSLLFGHGLLATGTATSALAVPLSLMESQGPPAWSSDTLTLRESRLIRLLKKQALPPDLLGEVSFVNLLTHGLKALAVLEQSHEHAGPFDGLVEAGHGHWNSLRERGVSPTGLERYVQCPMRYWMEDVLGTRENRMPRGRELPMHMLGKLGHEVLQALYGKLVDRGWPRVTPEADSLLKMIQECIQEHAPGFALRFGVGYEIIWSDLLERLGKLFQASLVLDQQAYSMEGWIPLYQEVEGIGILRDDLMESGQEVPIRGRVDRLDERASGLGCRVVDYKFSWSRSRTQTEPELLKEAIQGKRFQAPFYSRLSSFRKNGEKVSCDERHQVEVDSVELRFFRPFQDPPVSSLGFSEDNWIGTGGLQLTRNLSVWIQALRQGKFFLSPGSHCRDCSWSIACRSSHHPSWVRVQRLPIAREFRLIQKQRMAHE